MPPFDNSFLDELFDVGPFGGTEALPNCGVNEATKYIITEYLKIELISLSFEFPANYNRIIKVVFI